MKELEIKLKEIFKIYGKNHDMEKDWFILEFNLKYKSKSVRLISNIETSFLDKYKSISFSAETLDAAVSKLLDYLPTYQIVTENTDVRSCKSCRYAPNILTKQFVRCKLHGLSWINHMTIRCQDFE